MLEPVSFNRLPEGLDVAAILLATLVCAKIIKVAMDQAISRNRKNADHDLTGLLFARRCCIIIVYMLGLGLALAKIPRFAIIGHSLLAGAGVITLITGLASQQVLSNIISGVLIIIFKPLKLGDRVTISDLTGTVEDINLRHVVLRDLENNRIVIPNSLVGSDPLVNFNLSDSRCCKAIEIGIGYRSDIDKALFILVDEVLHHPLHIDTRTQEQKNNGTPEVVARVVALGDSSVVLKVWAWAKDTADGFILNCDLLKSIKQRFDAEGIEIPFPQRTISYAATAAKN